MRDISEAVFELLEEFDGICKKNDIEYCLEGTAVRDAFVTKSIKLGTYEANVSIDTENLKKLNEVIKKFSKEDRIFESVTNTKKKRSFIIRYLNTKTFCMNLKKPNQAVNKCIRININLRLNKYDNPNAKKATKLQIAWRCGANSLKTLYKNFAICSKMKIIRDIFGELRIGKKVFDKWIFYNDIKINYDSYNKYLKEKGINPNNIISIMKKAFNEKKSADESMKMSDLSNYDEYSIVRRGLPMLVIGANRIPAFLYDEISYITINGKKFPVPKEIELYLWFRFGIKSGFEMEDFESEDVIASETIAYNEFRKKHNKYFKENRKLNKFSTKEKIVRAAIRTPIRKMFREFERTFYSPGEECLDKDTIEL